MGPSSLRPRSRSRVGLFVNVVGALASLAIVVPALVSLVPIDNPGVQQCGTPAAFLLGGRTDTYPDANDHVLVKGKIVTFDQAQLERAYHHSCSTRITQRMVPEFVVFASGVAVALLLLVMSMVMWWRHSGPGPAAASAAA